MLLSRLISIILDIIFALIPSVGFYYSGLNFTISFIAIYVLSQVIEIIYFKGYTFGMLLCKILPTNSSDTKISMLKSILYHLILSVLIINIFNPQINIYTKILLPIVLLLPFRQSGKYNSVFDLIFNINWIKKEKIDV